MIHLVKSTFDFDSEINTKRRSTHSKIGYRERVHAQRTTTIDKRNKQVDQKNEEEIKTLTCSGLFCCDVYDTKTKSKCIAGPFSSNLFLEKHKKSCIDGHTKHMYPSINSMTQAAIDVTSGKWALSLACGAMKNRDRAVSLPYVIVPCKAMPKDTRIPSFCTAAGCYRRDNKLWKKKQYKASNALNLDLEALFLEGEDQSSEGKKKNANKYTAIEAVAVLRNMISEDGHRKYRIGGPNGAPPDKDFVKARFSKRKNRGAKGLVGSSIKDSFQGMKVNDLKVAYESTFGDAPNIKNLLSRILEIDDEIKCGGHDNQYTMLSTGQLELECRNRRLPFKLGKAGLLTVLRDHEQTKRTEVTRASEAFSDASGLANASAAQHRLMNK